MERGGVDEMGSLVKKRVQPRGRGKVQIKDRVVGERGDIVKY